MKRLTRRAHRALNRLVGPRGRIITRTGTWSIVAKACGAANLFISIPFVLHTLGPIQFGAWVTLASFTGLAGFLDFGFGNGAMNLIAAAKGRNAPNEIATIINESMRALWRIAAWLTPCAVAVLIVIPWHRLLGLPTDQSAVSRYAAAAVLSTIVLAIPLNLASRAQLGLSRGDRAFRWQSLGQLLTLGAVIVCARAGASLPILAAAAIATPLLSALANTVDLYWSHVIEAPKTARNPVIADGIRHEGGLFFILQLSSVLAFSSDLPLISALRGASEAGTYAIVQRLFSIIPLMLSLLWVPLWPMYREALATRDHAWVVRTLKWTFLFAISAAGIAGLILAAGFGHITQLWLHRSLSVSGWLLVGFAVWSTLSAIGTALATFLNAASDLRYQVIFGSIFAGVCFIAKWIILVHIPMAAVPWTTAITYLITCLLPLLILLPQSIARTLQKRF